MGTCPSYLARPSVDEQVSDGCAAVGVGVGVGVQRLAGDQTVVFQLPWLWLTWECGTAVAAAEEADAADWAAIVAEVSDDWVAVPRLLHAQRLNNPARWRSLVGGGGGGCSGDGGRRRRARGAGGGARWRRPYRVKGLT
jgi:hypothetical protein